jgi:sugar/nucleoside kinase (ribokinase family)
MPPSTSEFEIVILGHIAKDIIEIDGKSEIKPGGGVYYGSIACSHMGLKILVITRLKETDKLILNDLKKYGVQFYATYSNETSGLRNIYNSKNLETRICKPLGFAGKFSKGEISEIKTRYFILSPIIAGEIDIELLNYLYQKFPEKICLDIQGFIRVRKNNDIVFQNLPEKEKKQILSQVSILKLDQTEAYAITDKKEIKDAAEELVKFGPKEILITHEKGISVYSNNNSFFYPWKYKTIKGRTGRGDTSFMSYVGSRLHKDINDSLKFAAALTSLKLELPGPFTLPIYEVDRFIKENY